MDSRKVRIKKIVITSIIIIAGIVLRFFLPEIDKALFKLINGTHFKWLDKIMYPITFLGNSVQIFIFGLIIWRIRGLKTFTRAFTGILIAGIIVQLIKRIFPTARPVPLIEETRVIGEVLRFKSFPSGHSASTFAFVNFVGREFKQLMVPMWIIGVLVALSRVYIGAHFPSDIICGCGVGYLCMYVIDEFVFRKK